MPFAHATKPCERACRPSAKEFMGFRFFPLLFAAKPLRPKCEGMGQVPGSIAFRLGAVCSAPRSCNSSPDTMGFQPKAIRSASARSTTGFAAMGFGKKSMGRMKNLMMMMIKGVRKMVFAP